MISKILDIMDTAYQKKFEFNNPEILP